MSQYPPTLNETTKVKVSDAASVEVRRLAQHRIGRIVSNVTKTFGREDENENVLAIIKTAIVSVNGVPGGLTYEESPLGQVASDYVLDGIKSAGGDAALLDIFNAAVGAEADEVGKPESLPAGSTSEDETSETSPAAKRTSSKRGGAQSVQIAKGSQTKTASNATE